MHLFSCRYGAKFDKKEWIKKVCPHDDTLKRHDKTLKLHHKSAVFFLVKLVSNLHYHRVRNP